MATSGRRKEHTVLVHSPAHVDHDHCVDAHAAFMCLPQLKELFVQGCWWYLLRVALAPKLRTEGVMLTYRQQPIKYQECLMNAHLARILCVNRLRSSHSQESHLVL
jgi:hypothetical protein